MLVKAETGQKFWGTMPNKIVDALRDSLGYDWAGSDKLTGSKVELTATVEPSEPGFAFFKRPSKATLVAVGAGLE